MSDTYDAAWNLMQRGGPLMWPLLVMSVLTLALVTERSIFFLRLQRLDAERRVGTLAQGLARGREAARTAAEGSSDLYARATRRLIATALPHEARADDLVESARPGVERFMSVLSTFITAAPMLGILGTVLGIIQSFKVVSGGQQRVDLGELAAGISEALLTTGFGLAISLVALFPYNALRVQVRRTFARLDRLAAATREWPAVATVEAEVKPATPAQVKPE